MSGGATRSRWLWPLLVASLSVNILLGAYVGTLMWRLDMPLAEATDPVRLLTRATGFLPADDRRLVEAAFRSRQAALTTSEAGVRQARDRIVALLQAPELDEPAVRAAFAEARDWRLKTFGELVDGVLTVLREMPPERRRELMGNFPRT